MGPTSCPWTYWPQIATPFCLVMWCVGQGGLNPRASIGSHGNSEVKLLEARIVLRWVAFLARDLWCTLPLMIHPFLVGVKRGSSCQGPSVSCSACFRITYRFRPNLKMMQHHNSGPLHTCDWEPTTITLQALSLVEKAELVQVCFTLSLSDQRSMWMQDGCKVYKDSFMASNGSCFVVTWTIFKKPPLGGRPNTRSGDHGTMNAHNHWFIIFYRAWGPTWIDIHWNSIWFWPSYIWLHTTLEDPWPHYMIWRVLGQPLDAFFWALTISWSWPLARMWNGCHTTHDRISSVWYTKYECIH